MAPSPSRTLFTAAAMLCAIPAAAMARPGDHFQVSPGTLPKPYATPAPSNGSVTIPRPANARLQVPAGFQVTPFATGLTNPRWMAQAPNGDVFLAEPEAGKVSLLHEANGKVTVTPYVTGLRQPHGLAFRDNALYVSDLNAVWKYVWRPGRPAGAKTRVTTARDLRPRGNHWTRDLAFDSKGALYIGVGSADNVSEEPAPGGTVQKVGPNGALSTYAGGIRNPVGLAFYPGTDTLFVTVNERDGLGDGLVPDYLSSVRPGGFYGWPYAYAGKNPDPDYGKRRPDLVAKSITPDLLFQAHSAPLGLAFYTGTQFPAPYRGGAFVALHGSWNAGKPTGYKVAFVPFRDGRPAGGYDDFATGFWDGASSPARVWGRPAGLLAAADGSLLIADDEGKTVWRVRYAGGGQGGR